MELVGFVGIGIMGKPMAKNLIKAGYSIIVYDVVKSAVDELAASGASAAQSAFEVAQKAGTIVTMLPNGPEVKEVVAI